MLCLVTFVELETSFVLFAWGKTDRLLSHGYHLTKGGGGISAAQLRSPTLAVVTAQALVYVSDEQLPFAAALVDF